MELGTDKGRGPRGGRRGGARTGSQTPVAEGILPDSGWTEDSAGHRLIVDLPGFRKEEVKLEVHDTDHIIVIRGERLTNEQKLLHFELMFPVPVDSDMDNISGHFESEILYVLVPKLIRSQENQESEIVEEKEGAANGNYETAEAIENNQHQEPITADNNEWRGPSHPNHRERDKEERKNDNNAYVGGFPEEVIRKWERGSSSGFSRSAVKFLRRNKGVVITAVIAFSFGLYVSHKFHSLTAP